MRRFPNDPRQAQKDQDGYERIAGKQVGDENRQREGTMYAAGRRTDERS